MAEQWPNHTDGNVDEYMDTWAMNCLNTHIYRQLMHGIEKNVVTDSDTLGRDDYLIMLVLQS